MSGETDFLLVQWGVWQGCGNQLGMPSASALVMKVSGSAANDNDDPPPSIVISDATAMMIDGAVAQLKLRDAEMYKVLHLRYVKRLAVSVIAKSIGDNRIVADKRLAGAIAWIDCYIHSFSENEKKPLRAAAAKC